VPLGEDVDGFDWAASFLAAASMKFRSKKKKEKRKKAQSN
jgi:hypothetical protein